MIYNKQIQSLIQQKKYIIFDMDGVIIDIEHINYSAYKKAIFMVFWVKITKKIYIQYFSWKNATNSVTLFLEDKNLPQNKLQFVLWEIKKLKQDFIENTDYKDFNVDKWFLWFVSQLREKGKKIWLATMTRDEFTQIILKKTLLIDVFDAVSCAEHAIKSKPDPEIFLVTLEKLWWKSASDCLIFEDNVDSIRWANNAWFDCILIWNNKNHINIRNFSDII